MDILHFCATPADIHRDIPMTRKHSRCLTAAEWASAEANARELGGHVDAIGAGMRQSANANR